MKILRILSVLAVSVGFSGAALAQQRLQLIDPPQGLPEAAADVAKARAAGRAILRSRPAAPNWNTVAQLRNALRASPGTPVQVELPLFDDKTVVLEIDRLETSNRSTNFFGRVAGEPLSTAVLVDAGGTLGAQVISARENRGYQVTFRGDGHEATETDHGFFNRPDEPRVPRGSERLGKSAAADPIMLGDDGGTMDVMVVYSATTRNAAGGTAAMLNNIDLAVASANAAYAASGVIQRIRLVHTLELSFSEVGMETLLNNITDGVSPFGGVASLRNQYGADLVSLWIENGGNYCGIGWLMDNVSSSFAPLGYHVNDRSCAVQGGTMTHEMGHNMGLDHDLYVAQGPVAQPYAHGYVSVPARFRTIMSYSDACTDAGVTCSRINMMSTPNFTHNGSPAGNASTADAARMLNLTRSTVANFRQTQVVTTPSTVALGATNYNVTESTPSVNVVVSRSGNSSAAASVNWSTVNGSALAGQDFGVSGSSTQRSGTVSWAAGETGSKTITIPILDNTTTEPSETFSVALSGPSGAVLGTVQTATVTIADNDSTFNLQVTSVTVNENGPNVALRITRTGSIAAGASVSFATANGTALAGTDFGTAGSPAQVTGAVTFGANVASRDIAIGPNTGANPYIRVINDTVSEGAKTFTVTLTSPSLGGQLGTNASAVVTINNDDAPPAPGPNTLQFPAATASVTEGTPNLVLSVQRSGAVADPASVTWTAANGSATAGADYGALNNATPPTGTVSWAAGESGAKTISIPILNDTTSEGTKNFTVALSNPTGAGAAIGTNAAVTVSLADNDTGVAFAAPAYAVNENGGSVTLTVQRVGSATASGSVRWSTANGTAVAGQDFGTNGSTAQRSGTVSWAAGDAAPKSIVIPILNDAAAEGAQAFTVTLGTPSVGILLGAPSVATVTINDDDAPPASELRFSQPKYVALENGGAVTLTVNRVSLGGGFGASATVSYATQAGTALATSDFTTKTGTLTWGPGDGAAKTFTIAVVNNAVPESPESFKVLLSNASVGTGIGTPEAIVLVVDDDEAFPVDGAFPEGWVTPAGAQGSWHVSNDPGAYEGALSLRSDSIEDGERAEVQVAGTFAAGTVSFRLKVSSESLFDQLRFYVDGVPVMAWSGTTATGWQLFSYPLPAGAHTLKWAYEKDGSASVGQDAAWLDSVTLPAMSP